MQERSTQLPVQMPANHIVPDYTYKAVHGAPTAAHATTALALRTGVTVRSAKLNEASDEQPCPGL
jgi:hypothetical protein